MKIRGFTLVEMMVVISIVSVLTLSFFINFRGGEEEFALKRSIHQLALDIRGVQGKSTATQEFKGAFQGGYGIYLTDNEENYILFVDCDGNGYFSGASLVCSDCMADPCIAEQYSETVETISLETGVYLSDVTPNTDGSLSILFTPPDPTVTFYPDDDYVLISLGIEGRESSSQYNYYYTGLISWQFMNYRASCDTSLSFPPDCSNPFPGSASDPTLVYYDWFTSGWWYWGSRIYQRQETVIPGPHQTIEVNKAGLIEIK